MPELDRSVLTSSPELPRSRTREILSNQQFLLFVVLIALMTYFYTRNHYFFTVGEFQNIFTDFSGYALLAVGEMFVIVAGGIDLSVGSTVAVSGVLGAWVMNGMMNGHWNQFWVLVVGTIICGIVGAIVGLFNALMITKAKLVPFVATLVTLSAGLGFALLFAQFFNSGQPVGNDPAAAVFSSKAIWVFTYPSIFIIAIVVIAGIVLHLTRYGRYTYAIGSNSFAARAAGINVQRHVGSIYVLSGFLAGLTGMFYFMQLGSGAPTSGDGFELTAIAAVVIGGASLTGGRGRMSGTVLGVFVLTVVTFGLVFINVPPAWTQIVVGGFIALAAALQSLRPSGRKSA